jgi:PAS domain S-box-containing protein
LTLSGDANYDEPNLAAFVRFRSTQKAGSDGSLHGIFAKARFENGTTTESNPFFMNAFIQRFSVLTGFSLMAVVLLVNAAITRQRIGALVGSQSWLAHTLQVRRQLTEIELMVTDAETGQRGYLFTGDPNYLRPYHNSIVSVETRVDDLGKITSDNPEQQAGIAKLRDLVHLKLNELADTIDLYQAGKADEAKAIVMSDRGLLLMRAIRKQIDEMQQVEAKLEADRETTYRRSIYTAVIAVYTATVLAILGMITLAYYILRERRVREGHAQELRDREEWYRVTLMSVGDGVIATDGHGMVTFLNPIAESLIGISLAEAKGRDVLDIFPIFNEFSGKKAENPVAKVMNLGIVVGLANHTVLQHTGGYRTPIEDSAAPIRDDSGRTIGVVLVFRDATAARDAQEVLRKTEKLAAAARLSATVAHEINNPLEAVVNLLYIAKTTPEATPELIAHLTMAEQELERVAHITRQTLGFYRESNTPAEIDLRTVIEPILRLYANKIAGKNIHLDFSVDDPPPVWAIAGELKQVIANLVSNAIDAVGMGGKIVVRCGLVETQAAKMAEIVIADDGPGVAPELLDRIFDPFFTTKQDVGTGLGLWVAKEIVGRHGGNLCVAQARDKSSLKGAAFVICLPCALDAANQILPVVHN